MIPGVKSQGEGSWLKLDIAVAFGSFEARWHGAFDAPNIVIAGPSGSGKSTLLRVVAGVETRARGTLACQGSTWLDTPGAVKIAAFRRRAAWVPQTSLLFPNQTVRGNLGFSCAVDSAVRSMAAELDLTPLLDRYPQNLSGGEAQRVAIGRALLSNPQVLLLDEPFSALDRKLRARIAGLVYDHCQARSIRTITVTHDADSSLYVEGEHWLIERPENTHATGDPHTPSSLRRVPLPQETRA